MLLNGKWGNYVWEIFSIVYWNVSNYHTPEKIETYLLGVFRGVTKKKTK